MYKYRFIILEGMSASGKTTVMQLLADLLKANNIDCLGVDDHQILSRIFTYQNAYESQKELREFMTKEFTQLNRVVICDRFHISHLVITKATADEFREIEEEIKAYDPLIVFLTIPKDKMKERLLSAKEYRGKEWEDELLRRGSTEDEAIEWFKGTQHKLYALYEQSTLPKVEFDTGSVSFHEIAQRLLEDIKS